MHCYYHISEQHDPYHNLALEELLLQNLPADSVLLYLWQNDNTVVIGRNQNAWRECRLEAFAAQEGRLARRSTGGGAVYQDLGNQNFSFLASSSLFDVPRQTELICTAVRRFGIRAQKSGRNDIEVEGRKFSGNAYHHARGRALQHGTLLLSSDLTRLSQFLAPSPEKLQAKGLTSVRARVCNLCDLAPTLTPALMREALLDSFSTHYAPPALLPSGLVDPEQYRARRAHYASASFRLGPQSALSIQLHRRLSFGEIECQLDVCCGKVQAARVYSDAMDASWIGRLAQALHGCSYQASALAAAVPSGKEQAETAAYFAGLVL